MSEIHPMMTPDDGFEIAKRQYLELYGSVAVMNTYAVSGFYAIAVDEQPPAGKPALGRSK